MKKTTKERYTQQYIKREKRHINKDIHKDRHTQIKIIAHVKERHTTQKKRKTYRIPKIKTYITQKKAITKEREEMQKALRKNDLKT